MALTTIQSSQSSDGDLAELKIMGSDSYKNLLHDLGPEGTKVVSANHTWDFSGQLSCQAAAVQPDSQFLYTQQPGKIPANGCVFPALPISKANVCTFSGTRSFHFTVSEPSKRTKQMSHTFSNRFNKLYSQAGMEVPVTFHVNDNADGLVVKASPLFEDFQHRNEPVKACPNHTRDYARDQPWITSTNPNTRTISDPDKHDTIVTMWPPDKTHITVAYSFKCRNSCVGGPNRRKTKLIFTCETLSGKQVGVLMMDVRVCTCPGRDILKEEREEKKTSVSKMLVNSNRRRAEKHVSFKITQEPKKFSNQRNCENSRPSDNTGEGGRGYWLHVRYRKEYKLLRKLRDAMELSNSVPHELVQQYKDSIRGRVSNQTVLASTRSPVSSDSSQSTGINEVTHVLDKPPQDADTTSDILSNLKIDEWLKGFGMEVYVNQFDKLGLVTVQQMKNFSYQDLKPLCLKEYNLSVIWYQLQSLLAKSP